MYWDNSALSYVDPLLCHNCLEKNNCIYENCSTVRRIP